LALEFDNCGVISFTMTVLYWCNTRWQFSITSHHSLYKLTYFLCFLRKEIRFWQGFSVHRCKLI
jgi:hypothetical protein